LTVVEDADAIDDAIEAEAVEADAIEA